MCQNREGNGERGEGGGVGKGERLGSEREGGKERDGDGKQWGEGGTVILSHICFAIMHDRIRGKYDS